MNHHRFLNAFLDQVLPIYEVKIQKGRWTYREALPWSSRPKGSVQVNEGILKNWLNRFIQLDGKESTDLLLPYSHNALLTVSNHPVKIREYVLLQQELHICTAVSYYCDIK